MLRFGLRVGVCRAWVRFTSIVNARQPINTTQEINSVVESETNNSILEYFTVLL